MPTCTPDLSTLSRSDLFALLRGRTGFDADCECGGKTIPIPGGSGSVGYYAKRCPACDPETPPILTALAARIALDAAPQRQRHLNHTMVGQIGFRHHVCAFDNYVPRTPSQQRALDVVSAWASNPSPPFLFLSGESGVGKTHLAVSAYKVVQWNGKLYDGNALFTTEVEFLDAWRDAAARRRRFDGLQRLCDAPVLMFDDVGTGRYTDGSLELLFRLIDFRSRQERPTLFTTNLTLAGLGLIFGEKLVSRMIDRDIATVVRVEGVNHRLRATA